MFSGHACAREGIIGIGVSRVDVDVRREINLKK